jgi:hypothetical protein
MPTRLLFGAVPSEKHLQEKMAAMIKAIKRKIRGKDSGKPFMPDYAGHRRTIETGVPRDELGDPIPWMTYPAINYLKQIDFSDLSVFEYGCGSSTEFWSRRARKIVSVEHDQEWATRVSAMALANVDIIFAAGTDYIEACTRESPHDVIIIDGRWRYDCAMYCHKALSNSGMIILDNSERYPVLTDHFRSCGFIQVDFIGPGPVNKYIWSTSIFLSRHIELKPINKFQPHYLTGMIDSIDVNPAMSAVNVSGSF